MIHYTQPPIPDQTIVPCAFFMVLPISAVLERHICLKGIGNPNLKIIAAAMAASQVTTSNFDQ